MNTSYKINLNEFNKEYDKYIKLKLENEIESLEFLSIKINSNEIYQSFNADYGVLVGRVVANNGIGVPNAKVSVFIPLTEDDEFNEEVKYIYPYKNPRDKNNEGKRYNLLPRVGKIDSDTGIVRPQQPFGSFPIKEEIVTNVNHLDVYKKYYKYTALTNQYGDYMIFGAPIGTQIVHMSLDITDIGEYSMTPASMVTNLGYSENLFTENNTRIKSSDDLNDLPHIETQDISVDIIPFWGDSDNYDIGITRQDFRVRTTLNNTFTIFGSAFTDKIDAMWGAPTSNNTITPHELYYIGESTDLNMTTKRGVSIKETIYYYPPEIPDEDIPNTDVSKMLILDKSEYSRYVEPDGRFVYIISCNRRKKIMTEENVMIDVNYDYNGGIFTEFKGFIVFETDNGVTKMTASRYLGNDRGLVEPFRYKLKIPQRNYNVSGFTGGIEDNLYSISGSTIGGSFDMNDGSISDKWRKEHFTFTGGKIYSVSRFHGMVCNTQNQTNVTLDADRGLLHQDRANDFNQDENFNVGIIHSPLTGATNYYILISGGTSGLTINYSDTNYVSPFSGNTEIINNSILSGYTYTFNGSEIIPMMLPQRFDLVTVADKSKSIVPNHDEYFGVEWLNLAIYFPQIGELKTKIARNDNVRSAAHFTKNVKSSFYFENNDQEIAASDFNTKYFGRSDINKTTFIEVNKSDINDFINQPTNGFKKTINETQSLYINENGNSNYFYKGFGVDSVKYLKTIGLV